MAEILSNGSKGAYVASLQRMLIKYGFFKAARIPRSRWIADGHFGKDTEAALKKAQTRLGVTSDGKYGPTTRQALRNYKNKPIRTARRVLDTKRVIIRRVRKTWKNIGVHHTVTNQKITAADICRMHKARGWAKGGYHELHLPDGEVQTGDQLPQYLRRSNEIPAAMSGWNSSTYAICYVGDGRKKGQPTEAQYESMKASVANLKAQGSGKGIIDGHGAFPRTSTACPGNIDLSRIR